MAGERSNRETAELWLQAVKNKHGDSEVNLADGIAVSRALAEFAIAEQLERLNDQLAEVIDPTEGVFAGVLRVRTEEAEP